MKSLQLARPHLLILIGQSGSGKTTFGQKFAEMFSAPLIDPKSYAEHLVGAHEFPKLGKKLLSELAKTKQTIIYETVSGARVERAELAKIAEEYGYTPLIIWIQSNDATAKQRTVKLQKNAHALHIEVHDTHRLTPPNDREPHLVISGMHTYSTQAKAVLKRLSELSGRGTIPTKKTTEQPAGERPNGRRVLRIQ